MPEPRRAAVTGLDHAEGRLLAFPPRPSPASAPARRGFAALGYPPCRGLYTSRRRRTEGQEPRQPEDSAHGAPPSTVSPTLISTKVVQKPLSATKTAHHAGVAYGKFDHYRLVDTMRILPDANRQVEEPVLGIEEGGLHAAEALLLARYFMFRQVYHHRVRVAYDFHLQQFLQAWLPCGRFSTDIDEHQRLNDNQVLSEISRVANDTSAPGQEAADRIVNRKHFRRLYTPTREEKAEYDDPLTAVFDGCVSKYGRDKIHKSEYNQPRQGPNFPVLTSEDEPVSSHSLSDVLQQIPIVDVGVLLVAPEIAKDASGWLGEEKVSILKRAQEGSEYEHHAATGA